MYKKPKITNISCPICGQEYPGKRQRTSVQSDSCPFWRHIREHRAYNWWGHHDTVDCVCGETFGQYGRGGDPCIASSPQMALIYDHFRRLEPREVEEHVILFAMRSINGDQCSG